MGTYCRCGQKISGGKKATTCKKFFYFRNYNKRIGFVKEDNQTLDIVNEEVASKKQKKNFKNLINFLDELDINNVYEIKWQKNFSIILNDDVEQDSCQLFCESCWKNLFNDIYIKYDKEIYDKEGKKIEEEIFLKQKNSSKCKCCNESFFIDEYIYE